MNKREGLTMGHTPCLRIVQIRCVSPVVGGIVWVLYFTLADYCFGSMPAIKSSFHWIMMAGLLLSVFPIVIELLRSRNSKTSTDTS